QVTVQGAEAGLQRLGPLPRVARAGHLPPLHRHPPAQPHRRDLRRLRKRAVRPHLRQPLVPGRRVVRALRVRGDPGQREHLRRRGDLRALQHGGRRLALVPLRVRPRVRAPLRRARRRVLHLGQRLPADRGPARAVGAQRHRAEGPQAAEVEGAPLPRHAAPHAVAKGRVRGRQPGHPDRAQEDPRGPAAGVGDGRALHPREDRGQSHPRHRSVLREGRGVRGRDVRASWLLPARGGLHHVHPGRGALLSRLPGGALAHHRPLREGAGEVTRVALVALGGAIGSVARYGVGALAAQLLGPTFPWGTLFVNLSGSFLIALVMHVALTGTAISLEMRIFLTTGIMGGFTTYSSFNYETLALIDQRAYALASLNLAATVVGCLLAGVLGLASGRALAGA